MTLRAMVSTATRSDVCWRRKSGGLVPAGQVQSGGDRGVPGRSGREPFEGLWGFADRTPGLREAGLGMSAWVRRAWNAGVRC